MEAPSPTSRDGRDGAAQAASAFQSDEPEALEDEELLAKFREQREQNARWQLDVFAKAHEGAWTGECVEYDCTTKGGGNPSFAAGAPAPCTSSVAISSAETVTWAETHADAALAINEEFGFDKFRPERGNMAVSNAYTLSAPAEGGGVLLESAATRARGGVCAASSRTRRAAMRCAARLAVIREAEAGADGAAERDEPGGPLYDLPPARARGTARCTERGLTPFPAAIASAKRGVICVDWSASAMRYQLDRSLTPDGSLRSLELTRSPSTTPPSTRRSSRATGRVLSKETGEMCVLRKAF